MRQARLSTILHAVSLHGHWWTLLPHVVGRLIPRSTEGWRPFHHSVKDARWGAARLSGELSTLSSETLILLVHGLGGSAQSAEVRRMARAVHQAGWCSLRLCLRGADPAGEDFYHAGICSDLSSVLEAPELRAFRRVSVVGFSLGGHVCLKLAATELPDRVRAVVSVSAPLDLAESARYFDDRMPWIYRRHVFGSLQAMLARVAQHRTLPISLDEASRIHRIQDWDDRIVAPRFGFRSAQHYYQSMCARDTMALINVPTLLVHSTQDPMVGMSAVSPGLGGCSALVTAAIVDRGGHVGFPGDLDLGQGGTLGLENQVVTWLCRHMG